MPKKHKDFEKHFDISVNLFMSYVKTIRTMELMRTIDAGLYKELDEERARYHDQILHYGETTRDDKVFAVWLAMRVEDALARMR